MDFEYTKIAGAVLSALLLIFGMRAIIAMNLEHEQEKPGYVLEAGEAEGGAKKEASGKKEGDGKEAKKHEGKKDEAAAKPVEKKPEGKQAAATPAAGGDDQTSPLLAKADAEAGKALFKKCQACHVAAAGKPSTVGPNLWGIINRPKGSYEGFGYSEAMKSKGGNWTFADLGHFLKNPKAFVPGTKMSFAGLSSPEDEANVIAYLATLADTPVPLPK